MKPYTLSDLLADFDKILDQCFICTSYSEHKEHAKQFLTTKIKLLVKGTKLKENQWEGVVDPKIDGGMMECMAHGYNLATKKQQDLITNALK